MSKKSYKRNQNRLYREIKRRIIAEQKLLKPVQFVKCERKYETIKVKHMVPDYQLSYMSEIRYQMANQIAKHLLEDGYIEFRSRSFAPYELVKDHTEVKARLEVFKDCTEVEARLEVLRPINNN